MCIIDHYPLGNRRTKISRGLNTSEKLGRDKKTWDGQKKLGRDADA